MATAFFRWTSGADIYAKPRPLQGEGVPLTWQTDIVAGVENGTTGEFAFTVADGVEYEIFEGPAGSESSADNPIGQIVDCGGGGGGATGEYRIDVRVRDDADDSTVKGAKVQLRLRGSEPITGFRLTDVGIDYQQNGTSRLVGTAGGVTTVEVPANDTTAGDETFVLTWTAGTSEWRIIGAGYDQTFTGTEDGFQGFVAGSLQIEFTASLSTSENDLTGAVDTTGTDGLATVYADPGDYTVEVIAPIGYTAAAPVPITVAASDISIDPFYVSAVSPAPPSDPSLCAITAYVYLNGVPVEGARVQAALESRNQTADTILLSKAKLTGTTDSAGLAVIELVRLDQFTNTPPVGEDPGIYKIEVKHGAGNLYVRRIQVPNAPSAFLEDIPEYVPTP